MKVIVTGASGFVGKAVCDELSRSGHEVTALVRVAGAEKCRDINAAHKVTCPMSDYGQLGEIIEERGFDALYHFAWEGTSGDARSNYEVQTGNIAASCRLAEQCGKLGCKRFIYAGSVMEYEAAALMETEKTPPPSMLYSSAKLAADYMTRSVAAANNVEYIRAVISNIYGVGEKSPRLINTSIRKLLNGEHCSFTSGEQMYDFIYITDAAKMFAALAGKGKPSKTYYIGSREPRKLKDFLVEMRDAAAPGADIGLGEIPSGGISLDYGIFDTDSVYDDTGIGQEVSFREGIIRTAEWIKEGN